MEMRRLSSILWRRLWLILLTIALVAGTSYYLSITSTPVYETSATLEINYGTDPRSDALSAQMVSERAAKTYVEELRSLQVANSVVKALNLNMSAARLISMTRADQVRDTQLIRVTAESSNPELAKIVANKLAEVFISQATARQQSRYEAARQELTSQVTDLEKQIADTQKSIASLTGDTRSASMPEFARVELTGLQTNLNSLQTRYAILLKSGEDVRLAAARYSDSLSIFAPAETPRAPIRPQTSLNLILGLIAGAALGLATVFLLEHLDDTIKQPEDITSALGLTTLGMVAKMRELRKPKEALVAMTHGRSSVTEAYRVVRANFQFALMGEEHTSVVVTSALPRDGKSTTLANLAIVLAQAGKRIIVVDTDLRRPTLHKLFGVSAQPGLTSLLLNPNMRLGEALVPTGVDGLSLLPTGPLPPNPAELITSPRMVALIREMEREVDLVLFDSPPVLSVADSTLLSATTGHVLLVVAANETRADSARHAKEALERSNARVIGVVLNKLNVGRGGYYYYYYHRYYGSDGSNGKVTHQKSAVANGDNANGR